MVDEKSLESLIQGRVLTEKDDGYEQSIKRWAGNAERRANYVVLVETADDISRTVRIFCMD
jgi:hypothetical protein